MYYAQGWEVADTADNGEGDLFAAFRDVLPSPQDSRSRGSGGYGMDFRGSDASDTGACSTRVDEDDSGSDPGLDDGGSDDGGSLCDGEVDDADDGIVGADGTAPPRQSQAPVMPECLRKICEPGAAGSRRERRLKELDAASEHYTTYLRPPAFPGMLPTVAFSADETSFQRCEA